LRDHHGRNGDRAIIFPSACQITGSAGSTSRVFAERRPACGRRLMPDLVSGNTNAAISLSPKKPPNMIWQAAR
jgi:hypothetical protein